ncbi:Com family DNA-binding transcriptional regulator [Pseudomonas monteilii]|uniref:Com family DNA-binding transcriptional regulator n=1 Tax=Pseudomonas alabamensis TaxID=3064349 RepID=UPI002713F6AB|nr:Com family DNA-binding transcriptional regulator [Pseudomonas sp. 22-AL-CL-001]MDO7909364.1 Com family DNA-binding transcriptional regulator [Pseudomonas sp. 22-AL-CL-001]
MLNDYRCGHCGRLLARVGEFTEFQIKCSRCRTLNHAKASSLEPAPSSATGAARLPLITHHSEVTSHG